MSDGLGPVVCSLVGAAPVALWYVSPQPGLVLDAISASFPFFPYAFDALVGASVLALLCALVGKFTQKQGALKCSAGCSALAVLCALPVGFCFVVAIHCGVRYLWYGLPGIFEHGFPEQCHSVAHKKLLGLQVSGCDHQCLYAPQQLLAPLIGVAMSMLLGRDTGLALPTPESHGLGMPGLCLKDSDYDELQSYVLNEPTVLSRVLISITVIIIAHSVAICIVCGGDAEANARECSIAEPLLQTEKGDEPALA